VKRYFLMLPDRPLIELTAVRPEEWELDLLREAGHEKGTTIYRFTVLLNGSIEAPETAGRERAVLRGAPEDGRKMLIQLRPTQNNAPVVLRDGQSEWMLPANQCVIYMLPRDDELKIHHQGNETN